MQELRPLFSAEDATRAYDSWGCNCGPSALAAVAGLTLEQVRVHIGDFELKGYTNPKLMLASMDRIGLKYKKSKPLYDGELLFPQFGLARIQWEGPWTKPGVPMRVRYRHSHWVASSTHSDGTQIFDINCMLVGGVVGVSVWRDSVVPWLLERCEPKANGKHHITHSIEIAA